MSLPDYLGRAAVAAAQVLQGFDEEAIRRRLSTVSVELAFGRDALSVEGSATLDLLVRLLARLYPVLLISPRDQGSKTAELVALARSINPEIGLEGDATVSIAVGLDAAPRIPLLYAGSRGWEALVDVDRPQPCGRSNNPFGAGTAACIAAANLFRHVFLQPERTSLDRGLAFDTRIGHGAIDVAAPLPIIDIGERNALVGLGAVGNAAAWALARVPLVGKLHVVDAESIELGNLQRYVLARRSDVGRAKTAVLAEHFHAQFEPASASMTWQDFVGGAGRQWDRVLVALDSARDRRAVQASLPRWIGNAWTQPGDCGVSDHDFLNGACLSCLYLPPGQVPSEDVLIAGALGIPDRLMQVRGLLAQGGLVDRGLLDACANGLSIPIDRLLPFEGRPLRSLYVEGICGGAAVPLDRIGVPQNEVHVPLAHQSALAGLLLAAGAIAHTINTHHGTTLVTRVNVLESVPLLVSSPAMKDPRGICICQDPDYVDVYRRKYGS